MNGGNNVNEARIELQWFEMKKGTELVEDVVWPPHRSELVLQTFDGEELYRAPISPQFTRMELAEFVSRQQILRYHLTSLKNRGSINKISCLNDGK